MEPELSTVTNWQKKEVVSLLLVGRVCETQEKHNSGLSPSHPTWTTAGYSRRNDTLQCHPLAWTAFFYSQLSTGSTYMAQLSRLPLLWLCPPGMRLHGFMNPLYFQVVTACETAREESMLCGPHLLAEKPTQIITHGYLRHCKVKLRIPADNL